uniref:Uncharacterized protein n=1 Tax=Lepeophtheirus salmonis TaxID=72036 RepID=A0A0K2VBU1_LEPSM
MASPSIICCETLIQNQNSESIVKDVKQTENDEEGETFNTQPTFECENAEATVTRSISSLTKDKTLPKLNKHLTHDKSSKLLIELSKNSQEAEDGNYHFCGSNYYHIQSEFISTMQLFGKVDMKINVDDEYNTISFEELIKKIMDLSDQRLLTANDLDNERIKNQNKRVKNLEISGMFKPPFASITWQRQRGRTDNFFNNMGMFLDESPLQSVFGELVPGPSPFLKYESYRSVHGIQVGIARRPHILF